MKKQIFAVCDTEAEYAKNFMEYLNRKQNLTFEVQAFTGVKSLLVFAEQNRIEILLISEAAVCREVRELDVGKLIVLTEGIKSPELGAYAGCLQVPVLCPDSKRGYGLLRRGEISAARAVSCSEKKPHRYWAFILR